MPQPEQAVILCGGLGTRLRPLTDHTPKPMVLVRGRPFLTYLLTQVREVGIRKVLLLTGYLGEQIKAYFGTGENQGLDISYSHGPSDWDTGRRLWEARTQLDREFILLYSDNYAKVDLARLVKHHDLSRRPVTLHLAYKERGNIRLSTHGHIEAYDPSRTGRNLNYVEIGYMLIDRDAVLNSFPGCVGYPDFSFSKILESYCASRMLTGVIIEGNYYSISDVERLKQLEKHLGELEI
jgi:NDP-sugar pyrophosphorylase family protein